MIVINGSMTLSAPVGDALKAAAGAMMKASNAEAGCRHYAFAVDVTDPCKLWISEEWESADALNAHFKTPHMADFQKAMAGLQIVGRALRRYEVSSAANM